MNKFQTIITDETIRKIYSFSDIHADIDSLIIALRDCAKVIIKKDGFGYESGKPDRDANRLCEINILDGDNEFVDDLNYDWNPEASNTCVVIIGDLLDGKRDGIYHPTMPAIPSHYKPQIEIKILRFINSLMIKAKEHNSRLIKLLGNHEILNMAESPTIANYAFNEDTSLRNYYRGDTRINTFKQGNHGYKLLMENGNGIFVKINNNMFIHAQLVDSMNLVNYQAINTFLNDTTKLILDPKTRRPFNYLTLINELNTGTSPLWNRDYSDEQIELRIGTEHGERFCNKMRTTTFRNMFSGIPDIDISKLRLVVGHCPQNFSTSYNAANKTFTNVTKSADGIVEFVNPPSTIGTFNTQENIIFGITMECDKEDTGKPNDHYIYHVDVGASRAFDQIAEAQTVIYPKCDNSHNTIDCKANPNPHVYYEKLILGGRTPQVLEFSGESLEQVQIIRSTIRNTRINQERKFYEDHVRAIPALGLDNDYYNKKYLKYKNKYLQLKNKK